MIVLTGNNLSERQRELNAKVKEAAANCVNFDEIKYTAEKSDVDKLFKIDLASKYANIEYLIEVLKCGDSLYISRALKSSWMFGDDYKHIVNADFLHNNVIPFMSSKMKNKLLSSVSTYIRDEARATEFYQYCMDNGYKNIALKFLMFTSDVFKLESLKDLRIRDYLILDYEKLVSLEEITDSHNFLKNFIGDSFTLADAYVKLIDDRCTLEVFRALSYLYNVSGEKYLDLLEKTVKLDSILEEEWLQIHNTFSLRISKSILKQHKDRVLKKPLLYINILNLKALVKCSTADDVKIYAVDLMPYDGECSFWYLDEEYHEKCKLILDKITTGKFELLKQIFTSKYPNQEFETDSSFYHKKYYTLMTTEERETWALQQIVSEKEILGTGNDYLWYKFVNFEKAFKEIKKLITLDSTKRAEMLSILVDTAKNQLQIEIILKYFYKRHINKIKNNKVIFLDKVMQNFNVFEFGQDCWTALNKIFYNFGVYSVTDYCSKNEYRIVALVYNIINSKKVPEAIKKHIDSKMQFDTLKMISDKLSDEQKEMVFQYLLEFYMEKIRESENVPYDDEVKYRLRKHIHFILDLLDQYKRTKQDCPELVNRFVKLDWAEFEHHRLIHDSNNKPAITGDDLLRDLKKDVKLIVEKLPLVKKELDSSYNKYNISTVLKKLKVYFSNDIAKDILKFFDALLSEDQLWQRVAEVAAHGIFQLGDESFKADFMAKFAPTQAKINHSEIDEKLLRIQGAICSHALYSRPPVPLKTVFKYIKGDYVHSCLPMFYSYSANLPQPHLLEFVEALLDAPVSIQKHGIRLAFECFDVESLNTLVVRIWKQAKNVSLRVIIFIETLHKISQLLSGQELLFDTLKSITMTLHQDDDEGIFNLLLSCRLPDHLQLECIEMTWKVVSEFPPKPANLERMEKVITLMCTRIDSIRPKCVRGIIDTFLASVFKQEQKELSEKLSSEATALIEIKWKLTTTYIVNVRDKDDLGEKLELTKLILKYCLNPQDTTIRHEKRRILLKTCFNFIHNLERESYCQGVVMLEVHRYENINVIMQSVLETLQESLMIEQIYLKVWKLRLGLLSRKAIVKCKDQKQFDNFFYSEIIKSYAKDLANLTKEFVEKDMFLSTFLSDITKKIIKSVSKTEQAIKLTAQLLGSTTEFPGNMMTDVCLELISYEVTEIYLLVINLLPAGSTSEKFKYVIQKINKVDDKDIRCNMYAKFASRLVDAFLK